MKNQNNSFIRPMGAQPTYFGEEQYEEGGSEFDPEDKVRLGDWAAAESTVGMFVAVLVVSLLGWGIHWLWSHFMNWLAS